MFWNKKEPPSDVYRTATPPEKIEETIAQKLNKITRAKLNENEFILKQKAEELFKNAYDQVLKEAEELANRGEYIYKKTFTNKLLADMIVYHLMKDGFKNAETSDGIIKFSWK